MPAALPWDEDRSVSLLRDFAQNCVENDTGGAAASVSHVARGMLDLAVIKRRSTMRTIGAAVQGAAIALILVTGAIHFLHAPSSFRAATSNGCLFFPNGVPP